MEGNLFQIKLYLADGPTPDLGPLIPVFHGWIRDKKMAHDVMIDVADYRHVHEGPGVLLICHEAHYAMSESEGRCGLLFGRKRGANEGDWDARLTAAFRYALTACHAIEEEPALEGAFQFGGDEILFQVGSRREATNTDEDFATVQPHLEAFCEKLFGGEGCSMGREGDDRDSLTIRIRANGSIDVATLLGRLGD